MNAFEEIVAGLFRQQGYWTWLNYKIILSQEEKKQIGIDNWPRPEIDIMAYKPAQNELLWIECKSYLDSFGVALDAFTKPNNPDAARYKIFTMEDQRDKIAQKLVQQVIQRGLVLDNPSLIFCLVAGKVHRASKDEDTLSDYFHQKGWRFYGPSWIRMNIQNLASLKYEDDITVTVAKLLGRP